MVITTTGTIDSVYIKKGVDPILDNEVLRVLKSAPPETPVYINGVPTNTRESIPIKFGN